MNKTLLRKMKFGLLTLSAAGLLAACNTTKEYDENPDMGPPSVDDPVEEPAPVDPEMEEAPVEETP